MTVLFLEARFNECRTPRWGSDTPVLQRMVCGAPTLPGRTYCAACREVLISGEIRNGRTRWFSRGRRTSAIAAPKSDEDTANDPESLFDSPDLGSDEDTASTEEGEPAGARPLQPSDLQDWGEAA